MFPARCTSSAIATPDLPAVVSHAAAYAKAAAATVACAPDAASARDAARSSARAAIIATIFASHTGTPESFVLASAARALAHAAARDVVSKQPASLAARASLGLPPSAAGPAVTSPSSMDRADVVPPRKDEREVAVAVRAATAATIRAIRDATPASRAAAAEARAAARAARAAHVADSTGEVPVRLANAAPPTIATYATVAVRSVGRTVMRAFSAVRATFAPPTMAEDAARIAAEEAVRAAAAEAIVPEEALNQLSLPGASSLIGTVVSLCATVLFRQVDTPVSSAEAAARIAARAAARANAAALGLAVTASGPVMSVLSKEEKADLAQRMRAFLSMREKADFTQPLRKLFSSDLLGMLASRESVPQEVRTFLGSWLTRHVVKDGWLEAIVHTLSELPAGERVEILELFDKALPDFLIIVILDVLNVGPLENAEEIETLAKCVFSIIRTQMSDFEMCNLFLRMRSLSSKEIVDVARYMRDFIEPRMNFEEVAAIYAVISGMASLAPGERGDIIQCANQVVWPGIALIDRLSILCALTWPLKPDREQIVSCAKQLGWLEIPLFARLAILNTLAILPHECREHVTECGVKLIALGVKSDEMSAILNELCILSQEEREVLVRWMRELMLPRIKSAIAVDVLHRVFKAAPADRKDLIRFADSLILRLKNHGYVGRILDVWSIVPREDRESWIQCAPDLIQPEMNDREVVAILEALRQIPNDQRVAIVQQAKEFIHPLMIGSEVTLILHALKGMPESERPASDEERAEIVSYVRLVYQPEQRHPCLAGLFHTLRVTEHGKRASFIQNMLRVQVEEKDIPDGAEAVRRFFAVEAHQTITQLSDLLDAAYRFSLKYPALTGGRRAAFFSQLLEYT